MPLCHEHSTALTLVGDVCHCRFGAVNSSCRATNQVQAAAEVTKVHTLFNLEASGLVKMPHATSQKNEYEGADETDRDLADVAQNTVHTKTEVEAAWTAGDEAALAELNGLDARDALRVPQALWNDPPDIAANGGRLNWAMNEGREMSEPPVDVNDMYPPEFAQEYDNLARPPPGRVVADADGVVGSTLDPTADAGASGIGELDDPLGFTGGYASVAVATSEGWVHQPSDVQFLHDVATYLGQNPPPNRPVAEVYNHCAQAVAWVTNCGRCAGLAFAAVWHLLLVTQAGAGVESHVLGPVVPGVDGQGTTVTFKAEASPPVQGVPPYESECFLSVARALITLAIEQLRRDWATPATRTQLQNLYDLPPGGRAINTVTLHEIESDIKQETKFKGALYLHLLQRRLGVDVRLISSNQQVGAGWTFSEAGIPPNPGRPMVTVVRHNHHYWPVVPAAAVAVSVAEVEDVDVLVDGEVELDGGDSASRIAKALRNSIVNLVTAGNMERETRHHKAAQAAGANAAAAGSEANKNLSSHTCLTSVGNVVSKRSLLRRLCTAADVMRNEAEAGVKLARLQRVRAVDRSLTRLVRVCMCMCMCMCTCVCVCMCACMCMCACAHACAGTRASAVPGLPA